MPVPARLSAASGRFGWRDYERLQREEAGQPRTGALHTDSGHLTETLKPAQQLVGWPQKPRTTPPPTSRHSGPKLRPSGSPGWVSTPPQTDRTDAMVIAIPFSCLHVQRGGTNHRDGGRRPTSNCVSSSTDVAPPDRCVPHQPQSSLPAGFSGGLVGFMAASSAAFCACVRALHRKRRRSPGATRLSS